MHYSSYISIGGSLKSKDALLLKGRLSDLSSLGKDLYIDIKEVKDIDLHGLSALLIARQHTQTHGGDTYIFVNKDNPIFALMSEIKFTNQLNFRDCIITDPHFSIAS